MVSTQLFQGCNARFKPGADHQHDTVLKRFKRTVCKTVTRRFESGPYLHMVPSSSRLGHQPLRLAKSRLRRLLACIAPAGAYQAGNTGAKHRLSVTARWAVTRDGSTERNLCFIESRRDYHKKETEVLKTTTQKNNGSTVSRSVSKGILPRIFIKVNIWNRSSVGIRAAASMPEATAKRLLTEG